LPQRQGASFFLLHIGVQETLDSLTQLAFGAAWGEAVLGQKVGRKALLWGALLGTLPDLDVLIPLDGPVDSFVSHRGFSHSMFLLALLSPLMAWLITKIHPDTKKYYKRWFFLSFLVLETSVLLDLFTVYGTQIFWPFDTTPLAWPIFFIIDPLITLPILLGALAALVLQRSTPVGHRLNTAGLTLSMAYLIWAFGAREYVENRVSDKLARQNVSYSQFISSPAPFTTFLWRIVGIDKNQYFETYFSLLDGETPLFINHYSRNLELMRGLEQHPPVAKLRWFTRGYYAFERAAEHIAVKDLRMGSEPDYVFRFKVAEAGHPLPIPIKDERLRSLQDWRRLVWVWKRIWNPIPL
jgi:inner membrane protein